MEYLFQIDQLSAERLSDGLFAQADAKYGFPSGIGADDIQQQSGFLGDTGAGERMILSYGLQFFEPEFIVAQHIRFCAELFHQMGKVVGEGVVIVYDNCFHLLYLQSILFTI